MNLRELSEVEHLIEELRKRLHNMVLNEEFNRPEVLKASEELDQALNEYERIIRENNGNKKVC